MFETIVFFIFVTFFLFCSAFIIFMFAFMVSFWFEKTEDAKEDDPISEILHINRWSEPNIFSYADYMHCVEEVFPEKSAVAVPKCQSDILAAKNDTAWWSLAKETLDSSLAEVNCCDATVFNGSHEDWATKILDSKALLSSLKIRIGTPHTEQIKLADRLEYLGVERSRRIVEVARFVANAIVDGRYREVDALFLLDCCMSIFWNLQSDFASDDFKELGFKLAEHVDGLAIDYDDYVAFRLSEEVEEPCLTGCYYAMRIYRNLLEDFCVAKSDLPNSLEKKIMISKRYVLRCWNESQGGFGYRIGSRPNMLHTLLALDFEDREDGLNFSNHIPRFSDRLHNFMKSCFDPEVGGFAFFPDRSVYSHSTFNALRIYGKIYKKTSIPYLTDSVVTKVKAFLDSIGQDNTHLPVGVPLILKNR